MNIARYVILFLWTNLKLKRYPIENENLGISVADRFVNFVAILKVLEAKGFCTLSLSRKSFEFAKDDIFKGPFIQAIMVQL